MWRARSLLLLLSMVTACAPTTSVQWQHSARTPAAAATPAIATPLVFVMWPFLDGNATGNSGGDFVMNEQAVALEILATVRERVPAARVIHTNDEIDATRRAEAQGATHLLVPIINEWRQMRTDDPIGAIILPHNRIAITLRLMQLKPRPAMETGRVTFSNRARLTLNQSAEHLLNDRFRAVVRELIRTGT